MATERPLTPPPRKPVLEQHTPNHRDAFYTELVHRSDPTYQENSPIKRGTPYSALRGADQRVIDKYPAGLWFSKELKPGNSGDYGNTDLLVIWVWATSPTAESSYNASVEYLGEAVANPAFTRSYIIRRDVYEAIPTLTVLTPLTSIIAVNVTAGGTGYTAATGTIGTGGKVEFVISGGVIISGIVTVEGSGITPGQSITITGDGAGATAVARTQPVAAILVSQKKQELATDDPLRNEFVNVLRVYETLPGPQLLTKSIGQDNLIPEKYRGLTTKLVTLQDVAATYTMPTSLTGDQSYIELAMQTIAKARLTIVEEVINVGSSLTGRATDDQGTLTIVESLVDDGTAIDTGLLVKDSRVTPLGNGKSIKITVSYTDFPVMYDYDYDPEMGSLIVTTFQIVAAGTSGSFSVGVITRIKHIDKWRSMRIIETYSTPASYDEQRFGAQQFPAILNDFFHSSDCGVQMNVGGGRAGFSSMCKSRLHVSFGSYGDIDGLAIKPNSFAISSFKVNDVLNDALLLTSTEACAFSFTIPASSPTASGYAALIGTEQIISGECVLWKAGIFKTSELYVTML